jgi:hypothetical protein
MATSHRRMLLTELETSARTESKRMTNHNTPQLSRMGLPVPCATVPGLSRLNTRAVPTHKTTQTQNKCIQTSMPWVAFEPTIPVFCGRLIVNGKFASEINSQTIRLSNYFQHGLSFCDTNFIQSAEHISSPVWLYILHNITWHLDKRGSGKGVTAVQTLGLHLTGWF